MLLQAFADFAARAATQEAPAQAVHHAKRAVLDWYAAVYPGAGLAPARLLRQAHADELGHGHSSLPGTPHFCCAATAAWINGSASHTVEFDDIFREAIYHPGCPTIAAALAVAEAVDASGAALLNAVIAGYEISIRIGAAIQPAHYRYFHTTGTVGCLGAAAAASVLLAPGRAEVCAHALATAATFASGLQQAFRSDSMTKALHAGNAANVGVRSALGAARGVTGALDILEGPAGFGAALAGGPDWSGATAGLGTDYHITRVTQKAHACCGHTFAAIDAALQLRAEHGLAPGDIAGIEVGTYQTALDVTGRQQPATAFEAKFSLPYVVAHALVHGSVRLAAFEPERLNDPLVRALAGKVVLACDPELDRGFPSVRAARVRIRLEDGRSVEHLAPHRRGDPEAPLSDLELDQKFDELATPVLGARQACLQKQRIWRLDRLPARDLALAMPAP